MSQVSVPESERHQDDNSSVQVAVRIRPLSDKEGVSGTSIERLIEHGDSLGTVSSTESDSAESATTFATVATDCLTVQVGGHETNHTFTFDHVFPPSTNQVDLYSGCVSPLVKSCLEGYNATILAYGQTGSGKTHTIIGDLERQGNHEQSHRAAELHDDTGVIPRALHGIFIGLEKTKAQYQQPNEHDHDHDHDHDDEVAKINRQQRSSSSSSNKPPFQYQVKVEFLELYGEQILDLIITDKKMATDRNCLGKDKSLSRRSDALNSLRASRPGHRNNQAGKKKVPLILIDGKKGEDAEVVGICQAKVKSAEEALIYLKQGINRRRTEKTAMNAASSRSHAIFTLVIEQTRTRSLVTEASDSGKCRDVLQMKSKIHFVDLAGSERIKSAKTEGKRMQEGISINKGLLTLGNVISALGNAKKQHGHVPYRDSKLTRLLKGSLGGNHKTLMIACVSPSVLNKDESMNTLRYANRAKNITNHAKVNVDPSSEVVDALRNQVASLATELSQVLSISNLDDSDYICPFAMDRLESFIQGTLPRSKLHPGSTTRSLTPSSLASTHILNDNKRKHVRHSRSMGSTPSSLASAPILNGTKSGHMKNSRSMVNLRSEQELDLGETLQEITEEYNAETPLIQNDQELYHLGRKTRSQPSSRPMSAPILDHNRSMHTNCTLSLETIGADQEPHSGERNILQEIEEEHNAETPLNQNDKQDFLEKNDEVEKRVNILDISLHRNEMVMNGLTSLMKTHTATVRNTKKELRCVSMKLETLVKDKEDFIGVLGLFEQGSVDLSEMTKSVTEIEAQIALLQEEKNYVSTNYKVANEKSKQIRELIIERQTSEIKRTHKEALDLEDSSSTTSDITEAYGRAVDTLKAQNAESKYYISKDKKFAQALSLMRGISARKEESGISSSNGAPKESTFDKSESLYCNGGSSQKASNDSYRTPLHHTRPLVLSDLSPETSSHLQSHGKVSSLQLRNITPCTSCILSSNRSLPGHSSQRREVEKNEIEKPDLIIEREKSPECAQGTKEYIQNDYAIGKLLLHTLGMRNSCSSLSTANSSLSATSSLTFAGQPPSQQLAYKSPIQYDYFGCSSVTPSHASNTADKYTKIMSKNTKRHSDGSNRINSRRRICTHYSSKTQMTIPSSTTFSSDTSFAEFLSIGPSVLEKERVDFIKVQKYHSDCCWSSPINYFTSGNNSAVISSTEISPELLGIFVYSDCGPLTEYEGTNLQQDESECSFFSRLSDLVSKCFAPKEQSATWQWDPS